MVFCLKNRLISGIRGSFDSKHLPHSFSYGQISEFRDVYLTNEASFIIVVFHPDGIGKLLGICAIELRDKIISIEDLFGTKGLTFHKKIIKEPYLKDKVLQLNSFFLKLLPRHSTPNQTLIQASLNFITKNKGAITINQLVKHTGYTERHIERVYNENIGIGQKNKSDISR